VKKELIGCVVLAISLFVSCDLLEPKPPLDAFGDVTITPHGRSIELDWPDIIGATSYDIFFTSNGSVPDNASEKVTVTESEYMHTGLDETLTYKYFVRANAVGFASSTSATSSGTLPLPVVTCNITFAGYANQSVLLRIFDVPYDPVSDTVTGYPVVVEQVVGNTDSSGNVTLTGGFSKTAYLGFSVIKDIDNSGTLTSGDGVWGDGGTGEYSYILWRSFKTISFTCLVDWDTTYSANHIF